MSDISEKDSLEKEAESAFVASGRPAHARSAFIAGYKAAVRSRYRLAEMRRVQGALAGEVIDMSSVVPAEPAHYASRESAEPKG